MFECVEGCPVAEMDRQSGDRPGLKTQRYLTDSTDKSLFGISAGPDVVPQAYNDDGGASRFFYVAKASSSERHEGLGERGNDHPTVKPVDLMRQLVRLVTPPGGTVLDPFLGSGSTMVACIREGLDCVGIERDEHYVEIAQKRADYAHEFLAEPQSMFG